MPEIKLKHVISCSSEDKVYKAENLLKSEAYRKWKSASPGENQVSVILQFEKQSEIHSIDIGNEGSAFIGVNVGKSSDMNSSYKVLLVSSSFMSPLEGRNETKTNRVRMFGPDKLSQDLKNEKWDTVQIVCTQPFNKNIQYGLSFVKFYSPPELPQELLNEPEVKESVMKLGAFRLKTEEDEEKLSVGSWFSKRNEISNSPPLTGPAAIRHASSYAAAALCSSDSSQIKISPKPVTQLTKKKYQLPARSDKRKELLNKEMEPCKKLTNNTSKDEKQQNENKTNDAPRNVIGKGNTPGKKPFKKIMKNVVFVISGFQNPLRSDLRDKALEMGAKYKADWDDSCTHLICAFLHTPKYSQVLAKKGRIVNKEWISDCHKKGRLLPWRKYMLGKCTKDSTTEESEEEVPQQKVQKPVNTSITEVVKKKDTMEIEKSESFKEMVLESHAKSNASPEKNGVFSTCSHDSEEDYQASTDIDFDSSSSDADTDDEIRKVVEQQNVVKKVKDVPQDRKCISPFTSMKENAIFDCDEEVGKKVSPSKELLKPDTSNVPLPTLPNFFKGKHFHFYGNFSQKEDHFLRRFILAFNGSIEEYMNESVKYVITQEKWDTNFDEALYENENLTFVRPLWIYKCSESGRLLPYQPYIVVPDAASEM